MYYDSVEELGRLACCVENKSSAHAPVKRYVLSQHERSLQEDLHLLSLAVVQQFLLNYRTCNLTLSYYLYMKLTGL